MNSKANKIQKRNMKSNASAASGMEFETTHGAGFAPSWKPSNAGEFLLITPTPVIRQLPKKKGQKKPGNVIECIYHGGNSDNFYQGTSKKSTQVEVKEGDTVAVMLSHNLMADDSVAVDNGKGVILSQLSEYVIAKESMMKILFEGKIPIGGGRSVNQFITQAPKGFKIASMSSISQKQKEGPKQSKK
jgi:hypothetical protein